MPVLQGFSCPYGETACGNLDAMLVVRIRTYIRTGTGSPQGTPPPNNPGSSYVALNTCLTENLMYLYYREDLIPPAVNPEKYWIGSMRACGAEWTGRLDCELRNINSSPTNSYAFTLTTVIDGTTQTLLFRCPTFACPPAMAQQLMEVISVLTKESATPPSKEEVAAREKQQNGGGQ